MSDTSAAAAPPDVSPRKKIPLFVWILAALAGGVAAGLALGPKAAALKFASELVLTALRTLATPLIFLAVILSLLRAHVTGRKGARLLWLLATNTLAAIVIGLLVANVIQPGAGAELKAGEEDKHRVEGRQPFDLKRDLLMKLIPKSVAAPFVENDILAVVILAVLCGLALRVVRRRNEIGGRVVGSLENSLDALFEMIMVILHWLFVLVPVAVFAVVAAVVGVEGFGAFSAFGKFILAVLLALALQAGFYQVRLRMGSWVRPGRFFTGSADALFTAFSTASSTATLPVTYRCAVEKLRLRDENARLGTMVGGNMNNDGTALYEAMAALFVAQALGLHLSLGEQIVVVFMSVIASVGAAGIPEAGLVTMMAVFSAVKLPLDYIPLLLTVDWFLDRCRTAINVMGDLTVSSLLDGKSPGGGAAEQAALKR